MSHDDCGETCDCYDRGHNDGYDQGHSDGTSEAEGDKQVEIDALQERFNKHDAGLNEIYDIVKKLI